MNNWVTFVAVIGLSFSVVSAQARSAEQDGPIYDEEVKLARFADMVYPPGALAARLQGVVVIRVELDDDGNVSSTTAVSGSRVLIPDCLENAKKWKFRPNPRKAAVIVYEFRLEDGACHDGSRNIFLGRHAGVASVLSCKPVVQVERADRPPQSD